MKTKCILAILAANLCILISCTTDAAKTYHNQPLIVANHATIDYKIGNDWNYGQWNIAPEIENDTLTVICYDSLERFLFKTDKDSIQFEIKPNTTKRFYVLLKDSLYAHTIIQGLQFKAQAIKFEKDKENKDIQISYSKSDNAYLNDLKKQYPLTDLVQDSKTDLEKILHVLNWTSNRWKHNGNNSPKKNDAISILKEVEEGQRFPCFAYAIVLRDQLNALGFKARTVYLKTQDAKTRSFSPGHVATEVYLNDLQKWIFLDGQFNVIPTLNGLPLNAVEFQNAICHHYEELVLASKRDVSKRNYIEFVYDYLFYLDTTLDNRYIANQKTIKGKKSVMLVPNGAEYLSRVGFWNMNIDHCLYTNSIKDFYKKPI